MGLFPIRAKLNFFHDLIVSAIDVPIGMLLFLILSNVIPYGGPINYSDPVPYNGQN